MWLHFMSTVTAGPLAIGSTALSCHSTMIHGLGGGRGRGGRSGAPWDTSLDAPLAEDLLLVFKRMDSPVIFYCPNPVKIKYPSQFIDRKLRLKGIPKGKDYMVRG